MYLPLTITQSRMLGSGVARVIVSGGGGAECERRRRELF